MYSLTADQTFSPCSWQMNPPKKRKRILSLPSWWALRYKLWQYFIRDLKTRTYLFSLHFHHDIFLRLDVTGRWAYLNRTLTLWKATFSYFENTLKTTWRSFTKAALLVVSHKPLRRAHKVDARVEAWTLAECNLFLYSLCCLCWKLLLNTEYSRDPHG